MDLDGIILYNFMDATSQLMRDESVTPWRGPWEKLLLFFWVSIDVLSKSEGIVVDLTTFIDIDQSLIKIFVGYGFNIN